MPGTAQDRYRAASGHEGSPMAASPSVVAQQTLRAAYDRHIQSLAVGNLEREQPFSWPNGLLSLFSYFLMLTDILRTGLGIHTLPYQSLEPNAFVYFGPLAYVTAHLTTHNATTTDSLKFWTYKYDTTSLGMRTVAEFFALEAWSPCVMYHQLCDETNGVPLKSVFAMVDSVVHAVARTPHHAMTLRSHHEFKDRVYHYALPWFFNTPKTRTTQAVHFSHARPLHSICSTLSNARRPYSCDQSWTNARRLACKAGDRACEATYQTAPRIWEAILERQAALARAYANHSIEFVVLDAMEDYPRGSLTYQGRKDIDVVVFSRIQQCNSSSHCETVAVDDYRYEAATFIMNAVDWYIVVGVLRAVGQTYMWLRLLVLVVGCAMARLRESRFNGATPLALVIVCFRTVFLIPSQVVVYGSSFPVSCYLLAHLIDSPAAYAVVQAYFTSLLGQMHWSVSDLFQHCAVSMRTVWVVGFLCHRVVCLSRRSNWSPIHGVPGTAEFAITFIASLTIVAQFRAVAFRRATVASVVEVVPSARRAHFHAEKLDATHSTLGNLVGGSPIDFQCLLCGFCVLVGITAAVGLTRRCFPRLLSFRLTLTSTTIAPYSAGTLWPRSRLVVSWHGAVMSTDTKDKHTPLKDDHVQPAVATTASSRFASVQMAKQLYHELRNAPDKAMIVRETTVSKLLQHDMMHVLRRPREIESTVYLINLAVMTDLFTLLDLRVQDGKLIGLYATKATHRCFLLPYGLMTMDVDIPINWDTLELVAVVNSKDLAWSDLLRCG